MPLQQTVFHARHLHAGATMAPFAGWDMPIHYGSQIEEHRQVRGDVGLFDVSHMVVADINGRGATALLQWLLANDVSKIQHDGKAVYSCMLNETAGVIDDLIAYRIDPESYRLVLNAGTASGDLEWIVSHCGRFDCTIDRRDDLAIIALQGPNAESTLATLLNDDSLKTISRFSAVTRNELFIARTGYTGEDGFELIADKTRALILWDQLTDSGVPPIGLGARDTLRLEAGFCLYGQDLDSTASPLESGLGWTVSWEPADRDFIGREALSRQRETGHQRFIGLLLEEKGILRSGMKLLSGDQNIGTTTSGGFSPSLERSIAFARIAADAVDNPELYVDIRGKKKRVRTVKLPFVRNGKPCFTL